MRALLRNFGLKMGQITRPKWAARASELAPGNELLELLTDAVLRVRETLLDQLRRLDRKVLDTAKADPVVRVLMTAPGAYVGLTFRGAIDDPARSVRANWQGWLFALR